MTPAELRKDYVHASTNMLEAIAMAGNILIKKYPKAWQVKLAGLQKIGLEQDQPGVGRQDNHPGQDDQDQGRHEQRGTDTCKILRGEKVMESVFKSRTMDNIYAEIQQVYLGDSRPWILGFSGGKDSTCMIQVIWSALEKTAKVKTYKKDLHHIV